jgi:hypothetical protein
LIIAKRRDAMETIQEVVYLTSLLADERCAARVGFSLLQSFAKYLLLGRQWHSHQKRGGLVQWNYREARRWSAMS